MNELTKETTGSNYTNYYYDSNGNLTKEMPNSGSAVNYYYDSLNRLNKVTGPSLNEIYKYDGTGNRAQVSSSGVVTNFLYDGANAIVERTSSQNTNKSYVRNPAAAGGIAGIIKRSASGAADIYYHYDAQGTVTETSNPSSVKVNSYVYDSFGNIVKSTGAITDNHKFLTKEQDKTGLIYFGKRYYNPRIGRFITPDPSGMIDGPNIYVYCNNDPINYVDLWGLSQDKATPWWESGQKKPIVLVQLKKGKNSLIDAGYTSGGVSCASSGGGGISARVTVGSSSGYRYVGSGEATIAAKTGYVPNTYNGAPKAVFYTPDEGLVSASQAKQIYNLTTKPTYRLELDTSSVTNFYAGNGQGIKGIEMITRDKIPVKGIKKLEE